MRYMAVTMPVQRRSGRHCLGDDLQASMAPDMHRICTVERRITGSQSFDWRRNFSTSHNSPWRNADLNKTLRGADSYHSSERKSGNNGNRCRAWWERSHVIQGHHGQNKKFYSVFKATSIAAAYHRIRLFPRYRSESVKHISLSIKLSKSGPNLCI